jgi:hypothetical protein
MKYFPINEEPFKAKLGLNLLNLSEWLERDENFAAHAELRKSLVANRRDEVLAVTPGNEDACFELFELVGEKVPLIAKPASAAGALSILAGAVQEDFVILTKGAEARVGAALVCFPSRWSLSSKIGKDSDGVHAPVPGFHAIAKQTKAFLERIAEDKPMWRTNWTIHDSGELFCPKADEHPPLSTEKVLGSTFFRCERQTLRRMPKTGQVVFTIRTYVTPMLEVIADPVRRANLKKTLVSMPEDMANYKGMGAFKDSLIKAL